MQKKAMEFLFALLISCEETGRELSGIFWEFESSIRKQVNTAASSLVHVYSDSDLVT